ncbi:HEAT repeat domain-containing protein [Flavobacterium sp. F372]|uniref:HEAT repeat domain-containing protein n=1 Tax=Flavobacterium bernardetii TaxID=2813823 RepID=A0ABR7J2U3_9FLAO|nr:HEAT repeat domain-containing protein [Flavobacterium bernardetii]MBC5836253.1 HEAT repeat domain-containing protein [Flavobacterium bernardetii]NHF71473.1 HEAT repeat domain-containing protein [Flavobacterium bernardetii]
MKIKIIITIFLLTFYAKVQSQDLTNFKNDFKLSLDKAFNEKNLNDLFSKYPHLLTPQSDITQLTSNLKGENLYTFPLSDFKNDNLYKENIDNMLNSDNSFQRIFSYLIIGASNDITKEDILLNKLKTEKEKGNLIWCGMSLLNLKTKHTTEIFDFLVENENFGDAHMLPLFVKLDKNSLQETAYKRYNSESLKAKILAIQILSQTGKNPETEKIVLDSVKNWDMNIKGYAIYTVKELQMGNLLETFKPFLDNDKTKKIALQALANSPTISDNEYLKSLTTQKDSISDELLDCFFESKKIENIKFWLELLKTKKVSSDYYFSVPNNRLIYSEELLPNIQNTLIECKNEKIIEELVRALQGRNDIESTNILIGFLKHQNSSIRYWSADALKGNKNQKILDILPNLINDEEYRTTALVNLLIENNINNQQSTFEKIYKNSGEDLDWERSSIEYLTSYPLEKYKELFKKILKNEKSDFSIRYDVALGLGRLKDITSVDLLIKVCEETRKESDLNSRTYLEALAMIKGEKAKKEIETFLNSDEDVVKEVASELLKKWN